jgi:DNA gyrase subunit B
MTGPKNPASEGESYDPYYGAETITVLKGLASVRQRPGMFMGDTNDGSGLHRMIQKVAANSADDPWCDEISVSLNPDGSVTIVDNGRPIQSSRRFSIWDDCLRSQLNSDEVTAVEYVLGTVWGGLHGVSVYIVSALSRCMELTVRSRDMEYRVLLENGVPQDLSVASINPEAGSGTRISFLPSPEVFSMTDFDFDQVERGLRRFAFRRWRTTIVLDDLRGAAPTRVILSPPAVLKTIEKAPPHG